MQNNSHLGETKEHRLERFSGPPIEIIESLLASVESNFNNEIGSTLDDPENPKTLLMILGIHSVALTLAYGFFNKEGKQGYKAFLKHYMDGETPDTKFSTIAFQIHDWRNVITHRWFNVTGHHIGYDFDMTEGWKKEGEVVYINPKIYLRQYLRAFKKREGGMLYRYPEILTTDEMLEGAKQRFLSKYIEKP